MKTLTLNYQRTFDLNDVIGWETQNKMVKDLWDKFVDNGHKVYVDENVIECDLEGDFFIFVKRKLPSIDIDTIRFDKVLNKDGNEIKGGWGNE